MSQRSPSSWTSTGTTVDDVEDLPEGPEHLFKAVIADINFLSSSSEANPVIVEKTRSVHDLIRNGPSALMGGGDRPKLRWIHLPMNNMTWVEHLMSTLFDEQNSRLAQTDDNDIEMTMFDGVLRDDLWKKAFHGRKSSGIHSRFMMPLAAHYSPLDSENADSDDGVPTWSTDSNVIALYLPYLHWETYNSWKSRQERISRSKKLNEKGLPCDCFEDDASELLDEREKRNESVMHHYLFHERPVHDRRTLDQSYFYNLRNVAHRDEHQVVGQHTWELKRLGVDRDPARKMMMVDQLWMWMVDEDTIITAFPETDSLKGAEEDDNDSANVLRRILDLLPEAVQRANVKSVNGLMAFIIDHCTGVFNRWDIQPELAFFEFFADEIGAVGTDINHLFSHFRAVSNSIEARWTDNAMSWTRMSEELIQLFSIQEEIKLMGKVDRIITDLEKIDFLCGQQEDVVQNLLKCSRPNLSRSRRDSLTTTTTGVGNSRHLMELCETVKKRRASWSGMRTTARELNKSLQNLLDLKQRQAAVSEARTVRNQIVISAKQGRSIMVLTVFTIFLLPVSVVAAVFGMNAKEIVDNGNSYFSIRRISVIGGSVTGVLVVIALVAAFSESTRVAVAKSSRAVSSVLPGWMQTEKESIKHID